MTTWLKQSTVVTVQLGAFLDATDGVVPETGLATNMDNATTGIRVSKNGAVMIDRNSTTVPAHDDDGMYRVALSATDTDTLGALRIQYEESGVATPAWRDFMVVSANVWDTFFGADTLQADLIEMGGVAQSATDLKDFADDGYDPTTDKITGVLLADTVTVLTNLPSIPANWLTAAGINAAAFTEPKFGADFLTAAKIADNAFLAINFAASSLDGKGDWNIGKGGYSLTLADWNVGKTGYSLTQAFPSNFAATGITAGGVVDADVKAINSSTTAAVQLALSANQIENGVCEGTPTTTDIQTDLAETQDDIYIGRTVIFTSGAARGEASDITDYVGSTGTLIVTALANAPAASDTFILI